MARIYWQIKRAIGGFSDGSRSGIPFSYRYGEFLDFKTDPDSLIVQPTATLDSTSTVLGMPLWCEIKGTQIYLYDDLGKIYRRNGDNDYGLLKTVTDSAGQGLGIFADYLWYASQDKIGKYGPLSGAATFTDNVQTLETDVQFHPLKGFTNQLCIGNGKYLATIDDAGIFTAQKLTFLPEERVRCLEVWNNYLVIGTQFGSDLNAPRGNIYIWDGVSTSYNDIVPTSGVVNALLNDNGVLCSWIGNQADFYQYDGTPNVRVEVLPRLDYNELTVLPGAVGMWRNESRFGPSAGTSSETPKGIYTYGRQNRNFPKVLSFDHALSTGDKKGTNVSIGMFKQISPLKAIFSWKVNTTVGVDRITTESYATEATYESVIYDNQRPHLERKPIQERLVLEQPLRNGEYVKFYLRKQGETDFTLLGQVDETNGYGKSAFTFDCQFDLDAKEIYDCKGYQHEKKLVWGGTGDTRPVISSSTLSFDEDPDINVNDV